MTSDSRSSRDSGRKVRMPATKFGHLQKRLRKLPKQRQTKTKK